MLDTAFENLLCFLIDFLFPSSFITLMPMLELSSAMNFVQVSV